MGRPVVNRMTPEFVRNGIKVDLATGCWPWQGYIQSAGYGQCEVNGRLWLAHRLSWTVHRGLIPKGSLVLHRCDNPPCCNPEHLRIGTHKDNFDDAVAKGRHLGTFPPGSETKRRICKLTDNDVRIIRAGGHTIEEFCRMFGVGRTTVTDIKNRKTKLLVPDGPIAWPAPIEQTHQAPDGYSGKIKTKPPSARYLALNPKARRHWET